MVAGLQLHVAPVFELVDVISSPKDSVTPGGHAALPTAEKKNFQLYLTDLLLTMSYKSKWVADFKKFNRGVHTVQMMTMPLAKTIKEKFKENVFKHCYLESHRSDLGSYLYVGMKVISPSMKSVKAFLVCL